MGIEIRKSDVDGFLRVTESHVCNGRWAVHKRVLGPKCRPFLQDEQTAHAYYRKAEGGRDSVTEETIASVYPRGDALVKFTRTPIVYAAEGGDVVLFVAADGARWWANRDYADMLQLSEVYAKNGQSAGCDDPKDPGIALMPILEPEGLYSTCIRTGEAEGFKVAAVA